MRTVKVLTLASMMALFLAPASFAGQPGFAGEKLNHAGDGDLGVDYTAEFAAASVPGQPASVVPEKLNYVGDGDLGVDYTAAEFQHPVRVISSTTGLGDLRPSYTAAEFQKKELLAKRW